MQFKDAYMLKDHDMTVSSAVVESVDQIYMGSVQIIADAATGTISIDKSNDGVNWVQIAAPAIAVGTSMTSITQVDFKYIRIDFTGGAAGNIDVIFYGKGA